MNFSNFKIIKDNSIKQIFILSMIIYHLWNR
nr:MAG TPA: hypothetical protein [Caudoviricetes sp.]